MEYNKYITFQWTGGVLKNFKTDQPPLNMLAFVVGGDERAAPLAAKLMSRVPWNWKLVLAFDQETRFSNEWTSIRWPDKQVRVVSWQDDGAHYYY